MAQPLFYHVEGKGDPIVLLHGFLASSQYFKQLRNNLASTHTVVAIDLLGFGRSPKPASSQYTYEDQVAAVHTTLTHLGLQKFVLVGHSLGSLVAMRYVTTYPEQVTYLGLFNPPMYKNSEQALETLQGTGLHYRIIMHSPARDLLWFGAKVLPRFPFNKRRPPINLTDVLRAPGYVRKRTYEHIILKGGFFDDIARVAVPTLLVVGRHDRPVYHKNIAGWQPPHRVTTLSVETGHHFPIRQPKTMARIIRSHLL
jgi:pimeloyl-ACP methyl ester carboxylesterase